MAKISVFVPKIPFLAEILFVGHTLSEEIVLNEASLGGSPTISGTLPPRRFSLCLACEYVR